MPWGFSSHNHPLPGRLPRQRALPAALAAGLLVGLGASIGLGAGTTASVAEASSASHWRQGVFPVTSFAGYTSHFGTRTGPWGGVEPHYGLDIAAPLGSPIRNWWGGVVQAVIHDNTCGVGLVIRSGAYEHIYCHLGGRVHGGVYRSGPVQLQAGQAVPTGALIGHIGLSGRTSGPHLHWGMRHGGRWLDPAAVLRAMAQARRAPKSPTGT
jgi:murein DD-endopeptidase MepM/ murein hydrolase activator NlpD